MKTTPDKHDSVDFDTPISRAGSDSLKWDRYKDTDILPFWVADMDFAVAPPIQEALSRRLEHPVYGYTMPSENLAVTIIDHLKTEYDWSVQPEWIVWLPGVVVGLSASCRAFCGAGDEVMVNPPIYHHFFECHDPDTQTLLRVPLHTVDGRWTYNLPAMAAACTARTRMLMMCSPHNPVGTVFTRDELHALAAFCEERDMVMISDEIHCDLVLDKGVRHIPTAVACPEQAHRIVTLMSGSKTWNIAGLNCSFAIISDEKMRERFRKTCYASVSMVPPLAYAATEAAYRDGGQWRSELLDYLAGNYAWLAENLANIEGLTLHPLQATYLAWIDARALRLNDVQEFFEQHGIGLSGGEQFGEPGFIRLNFACPRSVLEEGVRRMREAVASLSA